MLSRVVIASLLACVLAAPSAAANRQVLMPGVVYERQVQFTRHGPVAVHVITAPRPGGPYELRPALSNGIVPGLERLSVMTRRPASGAMLAGISGDASQRGTFMDAGSLAVLPEAGRSTIGIDAQGNLRVDRVSIFATWAGSGPRRAGLILNRGPGPNGVALFTPAWGEATPPARGAAEAVLAPFPTVAPNADLVAPVVEFRQDGGQPIPPGAAVLYARGTQAERLIAEAGATVTVRLLAASWAPVVHAVGGGPLLIRNGRLIYRAGEEFSTSELALWQARTAVGQRGDGRLLLVAVDGRQPGYSTGMTNYELGQTLMRLGAVSAAGVTIGATATMAFDGRLLSRPFAGERQVADGLVVSYTAQNRKGTQ